MHVVFVEPAFPANQREFVRGLDAVGVQVTGIGERPVEALPEDLKAQMIHYEQVSSVVNDEEMLRAVRFVQGRMLVDRLEATVEAHVMTAARAREACGIPGTSERTAFLCRDKPAMKEALSAAGIATAQSTGAETPEDARDFARRIGYPVILKPRDGAGAAGTHKVGNDDELERAMEETGLTQGRSVAVEEFVEGHEGFYDTITIGGRVAHEFVTHYFPNVLEAMRTRWISPQFITTNRIDDEDSYDEVKELGRKVIAALGIDTSPTHMEWFFGPKGLRFSEIGCRPPGVGAWDLYRAANEMDIYAEWANAISWGRKAAHPSRRFSAGIINLRPDRDGVVDRCDGIEEVQRRFGEWIIDHHLPPSGTPTQDVEAGYMANAWIRFRHPDYDELRSMMNTVGEIAQLWAR